MQNINEMQGVWVCMHLLGDDYEGARGGFIEIGRGEEKSSPRRGWKLPALFLPPCALAGRGCCLLAPRTALTLSSSTHHYYY